MFRKLIATSSTFATIPLRLALATVMIAHGSQKVLGLWGGPGFKQFIAGNTPLSFMKPTWLWLGQQHCQNLSEEFLLAWDFSHELALFLSAA